MIDFPSSEEQSLLLSSEPSLAEFLIRRRGALSAVTSPLEKLTLAAEALCAFEYPKQGDKPAMHSLHQADLASLAVKLPSCLRVTLAEEASDRQTPPPSPLKFTVKQPLTLTPRPTQAGPGQVTSQLPTKNEKGKK